MFDQNIIYSAGSHLHLSTIYVWLINNIFMSQHKTIETPSVSSEPSQISCSSSYLSDDCTLKNVALIKQSVHKTKPGKTLIVLEDIQYINQHQTSPYKAGLYLYPFNLYSCEKRVCSFLIYSSTCAISALKSTIA